VNVVNIVNVSDVETVMCAGAREAVVVEPQTRWPPRYRTARVRQLQRSLPAYYCKRIRNDHNYWEQLETYLSDHSEALFSHGICPSCYQSIMKPQLEGAAADKP